MTLPRQHELQQRRSFATLASLAEVSATKAGTSWTAASLQIDADSSSHGSRDSSHHGSRLFDASLHETHHGCDAYAQSLASQGSFAPGSTQRRAIRRVTSTHTDLQAQSLAEEHLHDKQDAELHKTAQQQETPLWQAYFQKWKGGADNVWPVILLAMWLSTTSTPTLLLDEALIHLQCRLCQSLPGLT